MSMRLSHDEWYVRFMSEGDFLRSDANIKEECPTEKQINPSTDEGRKDKLFL